MVIIDNESPEVTLMKGWITIGLCVAGIVGFIGVLYALNMIFS